MSLSSNSIIHFTNRKEALIGILQNNFNIKYCSETIFYGESKISESLMIGDSKFTIKVPMVSFCDIPLSQIKNHIDSYGAYGIGLTKKWAIKNKLNPVLYIEPYSHLAHSYRLALSGFLKYATQEYINKFAELENFEPIETLFEDIKLNLMAVTDIMRYMKNYEGELERQGIKVEKYRFSDEREWRYVPPINFSKSKSTFAYLESYYNEHKLELDEEISQLTLYFEPNDIKYVIINSDDEISEFIELLRKSKGNKYSHNDVERLTTRILTAEQIKQDF